MKRHSIRDGMIIQLSRQKSIKSLDSLDWYNTKTSIKQKIEMASTFKVPVPRNKTICDKKKRKSLKLDKNQKGVAKEGHTEYDFESIEDMLVNEGVEQSDNLDEDENSEEYHLSLPLEEDDDFVVADKKPKDVDPLHSIA